MNWTIELCCAVLAVAATEAVLFLLWYPAGRLLGRAGRPNVAFWLLKAVMVPVFVPLSFWFLKYKAGRREIGRGYLFVPTSALLWASRLFLVVWAAGAAMMLLLLLGSAWCLHRKKRGMFSCAKEMEERFAEAYRRLGGKGRAPQLGYSYSFTVPCAAGVLHPAVILPVRKYEEDELDIIFFHELTHCLRRDAAVKWLSLVLRAVYFFSPAAWLYCRAVRLWGEYACDQRACAFAGSVRRYFEVVVKYATGPDEGDSPPKLIETHHELIGRMKRMKGYGKKKKCPGWAAGLLAGAVILFSPVPVYGAMMGGVEQYLWLYDMTVVEIEEEYVPQVDGYVEYTEIETAEGITVRTAEIVSYTRSGADFEWTVGSGELVQTDEIALDKGDTVNVNVFLSSGDVELKIGLIQPDGKKTYIKVKGKRASHDFEISDSGSYRIFIENGSGVSVDVEGNYYIY